jgi:hypothetical protein
MPVFFSLPVTSPSRWGQHGHPKCWYHITTQHHNLEDLDLNLHGYENLISHKCKVTVDMRNISFSIVAESDILKAVFVLMLFRIDAITGAVPISCYASKVPAQFRMSRNA